MAVREQGASISDSVLNAMRSGAVTPVHVSPDPHQTQAHVLQLLRQGQLNAAFQQVMSINRSRALTPVHISPTPTSIWNFIKQIDKSTWLKFRSC